MPADWFDRKFLNSVFLPRWVLECVKLGLKPSRTLPKNTVSNEKGLRICGSTLATAEEKHILQMTRMHARIFSPFSSWWDWMIVIFPHIYMNFDDRSPTLQYAWWCLHILNILASQFWAERFVFLILQWRIQDWIIMILCCIWHH